MSSFMSQFVVVSCSSCYGSSCQVWKEWRDHTHSAAALWLELTLKVGTHITAPRPTRQSAVCWPSYGERIAAQFSTCKSILVRTDTRPSWPHRHRYVEFEF
ncbi:hypothetical protein J6590_068975 [Homalodisca vitripennis]|nr:hypothetical protein J6590_068975 [Homalodisca vitripennis]